MVFYLAQNGTDEEFPGTPVPVPGVRVSFDPDKFATSAGRHGEKFHEPYGQGSGLDGS